MNDYLSSVVKLSFCMVNFLQASEAVVCHSATDQRFLNYNYELTDFDPMYMPYTPGVELPPIFFNGLDGYISDCEDTRNTHTNSQKAHNKPRKHELKERLTSESSSQEGALVVGRLSQELVNELLTVRAERWSGDFFRFTEITAASLGIKAETLHGALMRIKKIKRYQAKPFITISEIETFNEEHLAKNLFHWNCTVLRVYNGFTRENCQKVAAKFKAQGYKFTGEQLREYHKYLVHGKKLGGKFRLNPEEIKAFHAKK